jgi:hypothetical protein
MFVVKEEHVSYQATAAAAALLRCCLFSAGTLGAYSTLGLAALLLILAKDFQVIIIIQSALGTTTE